MSAFLVSKNHIDALISTIEIAELRNYNLEDASFNDIRNHIGNILWHENAKSVAYRYRENNPSPVYRFERLELPAIQVLKLCHCLAYQSCEHPTWNKSDASKIIRDIEQDSIRKIECYESADWTL